MRVQIILNNFAARFLLHQVSTPKLSLYTWSWLWFSWIWSADQFRVWQHTELLQDLNIHLFSRQQLQFLRDEECRLLKRCSSEVLSAGCELGSRRPSVSCSRNQRHELPLKAGKMHQHSCIHPKHYLHNQPSISITAFWSESFFTDLILTKLTLQTLVKRNLRSWEPAQKEVMERTWSKDGANRERNSTLSHRNFGSSVPYRSCTELKWKNSSHH